MSANPAPNEVNEVTTHSKTKVDSDDENSNSNSSINPDSDDEDSKFNSSINPDSDSESPQTTAATSGEDTPTDDTLDNASTPSQLHQQPSNFLPIPSRKRLRTRRAALIPNTMSTKLCEQASARYEIKRQAELDGVEADAEEVDLCGIIAEMSKNAPICETGIDDDGDEEETGSSKRRRH